MKFFFHAVTETPSRWSGKSKRARRRAALSVALAALCVVGCVGRKQYAINEAILISERRQLEDEIYRLQFELRDALEENERLRQELGGDATPRAKTNDAFFPGLNATQTTRQTTGGARNAQATSAANLRSARPTNAPVLRTDLAPQRADSAPATGEAVETLPDYVPIPVTSTRPDQASNGVRTAQNVGTPLGVRREVNGGVAPVAASTAPQANAGNVVSSVFVDSPSSKEKPQGAAWSPMAQ
jgi:hypothetical protein